MIAKIASIIKNTKIIKTISLLIVLVVLYFVNEYSIDIFTKFVIFLITILVLLLIFLWKSSYNEDQKLNIMMFSASLIISVMSMYIGFINSSEIKSSFQEPNLNITHNCFSKNDSVGEIFGVFVNHINPNTKTISLGLQIPNSLKIISHEASEGGTILRPNSWQGNFAIEYSWKVEPGYQANLTVFYKNSPDFVNSERTLIVNDDITKLKSISYDCKNNNDWIQ